MGVSVESSDHVGRIDDLRRTQGIDWVIVGGESGPGARTIEESWILEIHEQCREARIAFFFKQWGGRNKKKTGRLLAGRTWDEMPAVSRRGP